MQLNLSITVFISVLSVAVSAAAIVKRDTYSILAAYDNLHTEMGDFTKDVKKYKWVLDAIGLQTAASDVWDAVTATTNSIVETPNLSARDSAKLTQATAGLKDDALVMLSALDSKHEKFKSSHLEGKFADALNEMNAKISDFSVALMDKIADADANTCKEYYRQIQQKLLETNELFTASN